MSATERRAVAAVARHAGGSWAPGADPPSAVLTIDGGRVALQVATMTKPNPGSAAQPEARLRDDRVARRFLSDLDAAVAAHVPRGQTVILTLDAPIKRPNPTRAALTAILLDRLAGGAVEVEERRDVLGNRVRFRILGDGSVWAAKVAGFVFSGDPAPGDSALGDLAETMRMLQGTITTAAALCTPAAFDGAWWLVLAGWPRIADVKTYRRAISLLSLPDRFERILMVAGGGRVEAVVG